MITINVGANVNLGLTLDSDVNGLATDILPAVPMWSTSDASVATITMSEDGRTAVLMGVAAGAVQVMVQSGSLIDTVDCTVEAVVIPPVPGVTTGIHIVVLQDAEPAISEPAVDITNPT